MDVGGCFMSKVRYYQDSSRQSAPRKSGTRRGVNPNRTPRRRVSSGWSMKLGAWAHARLRDVQYDSMSRRVAQVVAIAVLVTLLLTILIASGVIGKATNAITTQTANATRAIGFSAKKIEIIAIPGRVLTKAQIIEVNAIAGIPENQIIFDVNPKEIRERIMVLPWVEEVIVRRLWPQNVQIIVSPRKANALWQENGTLQLIDPEGKILGPADPEVAKSLPLVIGQNAPNVATKMFEELGKRPNLASHTHAIIRIEERRWNIKLKNGAEILLPEENFANSLDKIENLQAQYRLLDREFARLDVRKPGQLVIRPKSPLSSVETPLASNQNT
jgi:cell division protein FtsQ